ncbi:hypothetical protein AJ79_09112 [Helicocarpus griseus UAMH5409]|uniref:Amine oxidase domain-containing protein n=1 Tax=Helicocarpus griseus UAMH5409 TaxID=1447875 RepID=A0A2B7WM20_9EURO|nr:hypothetical protein AJ79_09112 [Helicocarpus griseus UAMH5409]
MRKPEDNPKTAVAIIGSGMAGLVSGYLLKQDRSQRFNVQVFEMQNELSLDSASITVPSEDGRGTRVDLPMRAFAGGFYSNLRRMYNHLGVKYIPIQFLFPLSKAPMRSGSSCNKDNREGQDDIKPTPSKPYFIHSSNNHRVPPVRPEHLGLWDWITESIYLLFCFTWYTLCCFFIPPYTSRTRYRSASDAATAGLSSKVDENALLSESLGEYLQRIWLPTYFTQNYIIPQFSAVTTCSHEALLKFPAKDLVEYATRTFNVPYYVVQGGVNIVEKKLANGLDIQLNSRVISVESIPGNHSSNNKVRISYRTSADGTIHTSDFDHVIMAVTPDVVGAIFHPLRAAMAQVPTTPVESVVHNDTSSLHALLSNSNKKAVTQANPSTTPSSRQATETQVIHVRSSPTGFTEAVHECAASLLVTTVPITPIDPTKVIHRTRFTRVLRTPHSKEVVNHIFDYGVGAGAAVSGVDEKGVRQWRNGDGNVWLVGGWCWDGMVLLEGCVVSAMRVADALGVDVPWRGMA